MNINIVEQLVKLRISKIKNFENEILELDKNGKYNRYKSFEEFEKKIENV